MIFKSLIACVFLTLHTVTLSAGLLNSFWGNGSDAFSPDDVTGLVAWYSADDIDTLFQNTACSTAVTADGQDVQCWADKSTSGWDLTEATDPPLYETNEQNNRPLIDFDFVNNASRHVTNNALGSPSFDEIAIFTAVEINNDTYARIVGFGTGGSHHTTSNGVAADVNGSVQQRMRHSIGSADEMLVESASALGTAFTLLQYNADFVNGTMEIWQDGASQDTDTGTGTTAMAPTWLELGSFDGGGSGTMAGRIGELLIYNTIPTASEVTNIEAYFNNGWAINGAITLTPGDGTTSWDNTVNVTTGSGTIEKTSGTTFTYDAYGTFDGLPASTDGELFFKTGHATDFILCGFYLDDTAGPSYTNLDYSIFVHDGNIKAVYESGTKYNEVTESYTTSDEFSLERSGTDMIYKKNGTSWRTSTSVSTAKLYGGCTVRDPNSGSEGIDIRLEY